MKSKNIYRIFILIGCFFYIGMLKLCGYTDLEINIILNRLLNFNDEDETKKGGKNDRTA